MSFEKLGLTDDNYIILDTETTGMGKLDQVIELGIIDCDGNVLYESLFNPGVNISSEIMRITGIRNGDLLDAPNFGDEWKSIKKIIQGKIVIGYNTNFDIRMLQQTIDIYDIDCEIENVIDEKVDILKTVKKLLELESYKQEDVAKALNANKFQAHRAVNDCLTLLEIIKKLNGASRSVLENAEANMPEIIKDKNPIYRQNKAFESKKKRIENSLRANKSITEIATELGNIPDTIIDNILSYVENDDFDYGLILKDNVEREILKAIDEMGGFTGDIYSIKRHLDNSVSLLEIQIAIKKNDVEVVEHNNEEEKLSLTKLAMKNNINRDDLLKLLIDYELLVDIRTISPKGFEYGIEYMCGDNGAKWPIYGSKIQKIIDDNDFDNDYSTTSPNISKRNRFATKLQGYDNFKHSASEYYYAIKDNYANLSKKQIKDYIKIFKLEDCRTSPDDYIFIKKVVLAEMNGLITRGEKYILLGSRSNYFNVSEEDKIRAKKIVDGIEL